MKGMPRGGRAATLSVSLALLVLVASCRQDVLTPEPQENSPLPVFSLTSADDSARAQLAQAARLVAEALSDPAVRADVYRALHASTVREHKLHFRSFLRGAGGRLLPEMARRGGRTNADVLRAVESLVDLEFYMPVKSQWAAWDGSGELIVATALRDHEVPVGYRLDGTPYVFTSAYDPPAIPVLAIVPVETDFRTVPQRQECWEECGGGGGGGPPPLPAGIYMTFSYIPGDYEGFLMGDPEFEVHVMARKTALDAGATDVQCAGEHAGTSGNQQGYKSTNYAYDQNGSTWPGSVMLFSQAQIVAAQSLDSATAYWVWEDDNDACKIVKKDYDIEDYLLKVGGIVLGGYNALTNQSIT